MKTKFLCPHCRTTLNVDEDIVLIAQKKSGTKGLVMLHAVLGNYDSRISPDFKIKDLEEIDYLCPICSKDIGYKPKVHLAQLIMQDENQKESTILFSKVFNKKCTYHIIDKSVVTYGECAKQFSSPDWFL